MPRHDLTTDVEPEPETADVIGAWIRRTIEESKDLLDFGRSDADAVVAHRHDRTRAIHAQRHLDAAVLRGVLDRVADEVLEDLLDPVAVSNDGRRSFDLRLDLVTFAEELH